MVYRVGMYIRRIARKNKNGSETAYLQLAHNERDAKTGIARATVIYSFGREDEIDRSALKRLVDSITRHLPPEDAVRAQRHGTDAEISMLGSKPLGGTWLLSGLWDQLGMRKVVDALFRGREHETEIERLLFAMVANRALSPSSKLGMEEWVADGTYIEGVAKVRSHQLYRAMDELLSVKEALEWQVYCAVSDLMNLEVDLLYFDTTSSYFEVDGSETPQEEQLRKQGYSKDKRPDLTQVVIGLAVTREGIPIRSWVWPGNTADMSVVEEVKKDLVGWKLGRVISVLDRGFASSENLRTLQRTGGHYIVGEKLRSGKAETEAALCRGGRYRQVRENLKIKEVIVGEGEMRKRYVLAYNPKEAEKQRKEREKTVAALEEELKELRQLPGQAHTKAACRLRAHAGYGKYLTQHKDGTLKLNRAAVKAEERYDGKYLILTSDDTLQTEEVALGYKQLVDVETAFRTLKTTLVLRPMYHRLEERIRSHVLLCWLALLLVRIAEVRTGATWSAIRREMEKLHAVHYSTPEGTFCQSTVATAKQRDFLKCLNLQNPPRLLKVTPSL
jgi:transposase